MKRDDMTRRKDSKPERDNIRDDEQDDQRDATTTATKSTRERAKPMIRERHDGDENRLELTQSKLNKIQDK